MKWLLGLIAWSLCVLPSYAVTNRGDAAHELDTIIHNLSTLQADFQQVIYGSISGKTESSHGNFKLARPGKFRWESYQPNAQLIIADGKKLWIYDRDLKQVRVQSLQTNFAASPAAFLSGYDEKFRGYFAVTKQAEHFVLTPKSKRLNFKRIELWFHDKRLVRLYVIDELGQRVELTLSHVITNSPIASSNFQFQLLKGVEVVN